MLILGVSALGHDPAAAIIKDGKLMACAEEERFNRIKHAFLCFPHQAINYCLKEVGASIRDVDYFTFYMQPHALCEAAIYAEPYRTYFMQNPYDFLKWLRLYRTVEQYIVEFCKKYEQKLIFVDHHEAHLASAFYGSRFHEANILSIDARGESNTTCIAHGRGTQINILKKIQVPHSLGMLYTSLTHFLGFNQYEGEGSVMGLSSYGRDEYREQFDRIIHCSNGGFKVCPEYIWNTDTDNILSKIPNGLEELFGPRRSYRPDPRNGIDEHIAASLQAKLEEVVINLCKYSYEQTGLKTFCLAGGVALNAKMNGRIIGEDFVDNLFIQPLANDAGCSIGAAYWQYQKVTGARPQPMNDVYLGSKFENEEIEALIKIAKIPYKQTDNPAEEAANYLVRQKIVGWFQGRMEVGPRALGCRSLLAHPGIMEMKSFMNDKVKRRELWRPFAPSILSDYSDEYIDNQKNIDAPYMILNFNVKEEKKQALRAAMHIDGTVRPQFVRREINPLFYDLIKAFGQRTGIYAVLNTSFNIKGEPIVHKPAEAIECFLKSGMEVLIIGNFIMEKSLIPKSSEKVEATLQALKSTEKEKMLLVRQKKLLNFVQIVDRESMEHLNSHIKNLEECVKNLSRHCKNLEEIIDDLKGRELLKSKSSIFRKKS